MKPAKLGGFASNGMVLCASSEDGRVAFVEPPAAAEPGERVLCEGSAPVEAASPNKVKKKKLMEAAASELRAVGSVATYAGTPLVALAVYLTQGAGWSAAGRRDFGPLVLSCIEADFLQENYCTF